MNIGFQPADDNVLVRLAAAGDAGADNTAELAEVVAVGPGRRLADGTLVAPDLAPGDRIALRPHRAVHLHVQAHAFAVVAASDVLGVLLPQGEALRETATAAISDAEVPAPIRYAGPAAVEEESLETDVAPDLLDQEAPTAEDLH